MTQVRRTLSAVLAVVLAAPLGVATPAAAQTPPDLRDLVGARGSSGETAMRDRGYVFQRNQSGGNQVFTYWTRGDTCVQVTTADGRYASIDRMDRSLCRSGGSSSSGDSAATAVIAGAAIVGLAAALAAHNKKDHDRDARHDDEYSRGYQDALYGSHYDDDDSEGYHDGYMAGEAERSNRRAANSPRVRSAPRAALDACAARGDQYQNAPPGSSSAVSVSPSGGDRYEITVATGHYRSRCTVTSNGRVIDMSPF